MSAVRRAVRAAGIEAPVLYEEVTESTNTIALRLAEEGRPEWTLVAAGHQTEGKGRLGRTWLSSPGDALLFSFVLRPLLDAERALLITLLAGASMAEACHAVSGRDVRCKWPNDLLLGDGKVGGILTEARVREGRVLHVVTGIGLNVHAAPSGVENAAALGSVDRYQLLTAFLRRFRERYSPADEGFASAVVSAYRLCSATLGRWVRATVSDGRTVEGEAADLDPIGNLVLRTHEGPATVAFGEVVHIR